MKKHHLSKIWMVPYFFMDVLNPVPGYGHGDEYIQPQARQASNREKIAQIDYRDEMAYRNMDYRDEDIHQRANRQGDWDYKQNWRYDREAFYSGETQPEAYRREHPHGRGGIGYDPD